MEQFQEKMQEGNSSIIYYLNVCTCNQGTGLWNSWRSHWLRAIAGRWKLWSPSECLYFPAKCYRNPRAPCPPPSHTFLQGESQVPSARNKPPRSTQNLYRGSKEISTEQPVSTTFYSLFHITNFFIVILKSSWCQYVSSIFI